ncbi:hypothetical protein F5050DRAFT_1579845 [Lentinula boryana]|uniref:F-box domain-containing protein n=1 Tax=Lentinula boryana TaxID=40481 RepID=A0ABQ8Q0P2_9AGAR|nr:hypothetical protein F5050DRAFT_1579845 [Lentinula boryana]
MESSRNKLLDLPTELLDLVFQRLDFRSLLRCTQVCHRMHYILEGSALLQYQTKLASTGKSDNRCCSWSTAVRLKKLEVYQEAWDNLRWSNNVLSFPVSNVSLWELVGGVLALYNVTQHSFRFIQLPSVHRGVDHREWQFNLDIDIGRGDFTIDPSTDLMVIVNRVSADNAVSAVFKIYFLSLTTGRPHTKARSSEIQIEIPQLAESWYHEIKVFDNHLAVLFTTDFGVTELVVCSWNTGKVLKRLKNVMSFAFLTSTLIVLNDIVGRSDIALEIIDVYDEPVSCCLHLPEPALGIADFEMVTESPQASIIQQSNVPFTASVEDRLLVINYRLEDSRSRERNHAIFVPVSVLLNHYRRSQPKQPIPWTEWGPNGTRILPVSFSGIWVCYVHGMRASVYEPAKKVFQIFDFSQLGLAYDIIKGEKRPQTQYLTGRTVLLESVFTERTLSCLPVRISTGTFPLESVEAVMLTEDALLAATVSLFTDLFCPGL